jgi:exosortase F-associated protein
MSSERRRQDWIVMALALFGLALIYLFQRADYFGLVSTWLGWGNAPAAVAFTVNKTLRMTANDLLCVVLIRTWFADARITRLAWWVFGFELVVLLPVYLAVKLWLEGPTEISVPWLQQIHRLVVNPMLMGLLFIGFSYQKMYK